MGPKLVKQVIEAIAKIRQCIEISQSLQKSYIDVWCRPLEFEVRDHIYLKVTFMNGIMRFARRIN